MNAFRVLEPGTSDFEAYAMIRKCQSSLHRWGDANGVVFDAGKESAHIVSRRGADGPPLTVLGVQFDCKLLMHQAVRQCATEVGWRLVALLRTQRFQSLSELVVLYKSHILPFLEYRTAAIAHAATSVLNELDVTMDRFLHSVSLTDIEALMHFRLAPLSVRRDIAILGILHRSAIGEGPPALQQFFTMDVRVPPPRAPRRHCRHMMDPCGLRWPDYAFHSALGAVRVYNILPDYIVSARSVKAFQSRLQGLVCTRVGSCADWRATLSWRVPIWSHPLRACRDWAGAAAS